jgi:hypothetical protein
MRIKAKDLKQGMIYLKGGYDSEGNWNQEINQRVVEFVDAFSGDQLMIQFHNPKTGKSYKEFVGNWSEFLIKD